MKRMFALVSLAALCGCAHGYDFSPYLGAQKNWQTQPGSYVKVVDHATLYPAGQFPDRPYIIMGSVNGHGEGGVARAVRKEHADAALIFANHTYHEGAIAVGGPGVFWNAPITHNVVSAQLIKFR